MSSKEHPFRVGDAFSSLLTCLRPLSSSRNSSLPGGMQDQQRDVVPGGTRASYQLHPTSRELDLSFMDSAGVPAERLVDFVRALEPFISKCELLGKGDLEVTSSGPISSGGFSDILAGKKNGNCVAIKLFRYNSSSVCLPIYLRLYKEMLTYIYLNDHNDGSFVSFIGLYSTPEHPLCLVFEFMHSLNLREYIRNNQSVVKSQLLLDIARGLQRLHSLGVVHANFSITNILVGHDGRPLIAGLGTAIIPFPVPMGGIDRSSCGVLTPELIDPQRWGLSNAKPTTASDIFAFALVAWEIFEGKFLFSDRSVVAGVYSVLNGDRPDRPEHPELSDSVWEMIRKCWRSNPAKRLALAGAITILEAEERAR